MKKLFLYLALATGLLAADAANDVVLSQRNSGNTGFVQRNVAPVASGFLTFDASKVPTSPAGLTWVTPTLSVPAAFNLSGAGAITLTAGGSDKNITIQPSGVGRFVALNNTSDPGQLVSTAAHTEYDFVARDANTASVVLWGYGGGGTVSGVRANGTQAAKTGVLNNQALFTLGGKGYYDNGAGTAGYTTTPMTSIQMVAAENWVGTSNLGTNIILNTTPSGTGTAVETLRIGGGATASILGGAGNMMITAGTGNSRTLTLRTTTSGGTATDALTINATQDITYTATMRVSTDTLSGAGAVSVTKDTTKLTSTGVAQAITLANGTDGQIKRIIHDVDGGSMVLTPTTKTGWSTATFTNAGESLTLEYVTTRGWVVVGSYLTVIAP